MLGSRRIMVVRVRRRKTMGWPVLLSVALHLTLLVALLIIPPTRPATDASDALTVDIVVGDGPAVASEPPAPIEAPPAPEVPPPPPVQQAEASPPMAAPAPVQQAEVPPPVPPPPVPQAAIPTPITAPAPPDVPLPPPPVQQAETPPPTPVAPPPKPAPSPPQPVAQTRQPRLPPPRLLVHAPGNPAAAPSHVATGQNAAGGGSAASNSAAWMGKLKQWWDQHSFYPKEASLTNEGGDVRVHIVIAPDGEIMSIDVVQGSGLSVLDAAALAVFRNAHLPPFPTETPQQPADVVVTLHYRPANG